MASWAPRLLLPGGIPVTIRPVVRAPERLRAADRDDLGGEQLDGPGGLGEREAAEADLGEEPVVAEQLVRRWAGR
jgi:hypothetical protein